MSVSGESAKPGTAPQSAAELGRALKRLMREAPEGGHKVATVAKRIGVAPSSLYAYLSGATLPPSEVLDELLIVVAAPADQRRLLSTARDDLSGGRRRRGYGRADSGVAVPRELPCPVTGFVGRDREMQAIEEIHRDSRSGGENIVVLSGPAGVGKSALAVEWGQKHRDRFPDGQVHLDLRGFAPGAPMSVERASAALLRSFGGEGQPIPADHEERGARLRSLLSGRRALVVLDNAIDSDQVRPLLPGTSEVFVVVTSRLELPGLGVSPGARAVSVPPLAAEPGSRLLSEQAGQAQLPVGEPLAHLVQRCGGLPLALRIMAAQLRLGRSLPEAGARRGAGLDLFELQDSADSVREVFSWSERRLSGQDARALLMLGSLPVDAVTSAQAASLLGVPVAAATSALERLHRAHLIQRPSPQRWTMHDLIREYAAERAQASLEAGQVRSALDRFQARLRADVQAAMAQLYPGLGDPEPVDGEVFGSAPEAAQWLAGSWPDALLALEHCSATGRDEAALHLSRLLCQHVVRRDSHHEEAWPMLARGIEAADRIGRDQDRAQMRRLRGQIALRVGEFELAEQDLGVALEMSTAAGQDGDAAAIRNSLGTLFITQHRLPEALTEFEQALVLVEPLGLPAAQARVHTNLARVHSNMADLDRAWQHCHAARLAYEAVGDRLGWALIRCRMGQIERDRGALGPAFALLNEAAQEAGRMQLPGLEAEVLNELGLTHARAADVAAAWNCHQQAWEMSQACGEEAEAARAAQELGELAGASDPATAGHWWREAVEIYARLQMPEAQTLRARMQDMERSA
ncbi:AAA family ATPase [Dermacoccaceae bacterium W4C1]